VPRSVKPWVGLTDDAMPPPACKRRILARQGDKCAITGKPFTAKEKPQFDHIVPLWLGGKNCEENLQAIHGEPHKRKTAAEATVRAKSNAAKDKNLGLREAATRPLKGRGFPKTDKQPKTLTKALPPRVVDVFGRQIARTP
jgi:5-methylcytosine-specific restriction protein A